MSSDRIKKTRKKSYSIWFAAILLLLLIYLTLRSCKKEDPDSKGRDREFVFLTQDSAKPDTSLTDTAGVDTLSDSTATDTIATDGARDSLILSPDEGKYKLVLADSGLRKTVIIDSIYVFADPWGGRHFDSVNIQLFCHTNCTPVYSLDDSLNFKSYSGPIQLTQSRTVWIGGVNPAGEETQPIKIEYVIERDGGKCPPSSMPVVVEAGEICMDNFEWPNQEGALPTAYINQAQAVDSCAGKGKRLCALSEWRAACVGIEKTRYPYGNKYNENYCPAKENEPRRSGRFPVCRSYFGIFDMAGNLWEWTSTQSDKREGFYMVTGGSWESGNEATCQQTKYSFYPQNRYPFVGFRCCKDL